MCTVPVLSSICLESYNEPRALYERLKQRGMDLVTVTDHDSIDAVEELRRIPISSSAKKSPAPCRAAPKCTPAFMESAKKTILSCSAAARHRKPARLCG
jgi:hypothetical protein